MLVSDQVQALLTRERLLLSDLLAYLEGREAPPEALGAARQAIAGLDEAFLLVIVGEFNSGKSSFINALLGERVLPEGVTPTTDRIWILTHGERGAPVATDDPQVLRQTAPLPTLEGVALVDTPGTNAIIREHQVLTEGFLPRADLLMFLTSADRPFTETERQFLELARRWGRNVIMVVNKADLLETDEHRDQVRAFVEGGASRVLGLSPPVHLVSARAQLRGGDEGFTRLLGALNERLNETERTRLKLASPLATARELLGAEERRTQAARATLEQDLETLRDLERQQQHHARAMQGELERQLAGVTRLLSEFEARADRFIDQTLRISRIRDLMNTRRVEEQFREQAIRDLPEAIDRQFGGMIDRFVEANLHFWEDVQAFLLRRATHEAAARTRFAYDRAALQDAIGGSARRHLDTVTQQQLTRQLSDDAQSATRGVLGAGAIGIGIGAVTLAFASTALVDVTGILAGIAAGSIGLIVLPARRLQALRQLRKNVQGMQASLEEILRREYAREQERALARLADAVRPYTSFTRDQTERLEEAARRAAELRARIDTTARDVERLG